MILLIKLSKVIALHVTTAAASAISVINGVCECPCVTLSHTQMDSAGFLVSTL